MKKLILICLVFSVFLFAGCTDGKTEYDTNKEITTDNQTEENNSIGNQTDVDDVPVEPTLDPTPEPELEPKPWAKLDIINLTSDKDVYHSRQLINVSAIINSNRALNDVTVNLDGINGRLDKTQIVNLTEGNNPIYFTYTLPRCNVCGGIREGKYTLTLGLVAEDLTLNDTLDIEILQ